MLKKLIVLSLLTSTISLSKDQMSYEKELNQTYIGVAPLLQSLVNEDEFIRQKMADNIKTDKNIKTHLENLIRISSNLDATIDIFFGELTQGKISQLEKNTRDEFFQLQKELYQSEFLENKNYVFGNLQPDKFLKEKAKKSFQIKQDFSFQKLFEFLKSELNSKKISHTTTLEIDKKVVGGYFSREKNKIYFNEINPNLSSLMGFIHEFGHSYYIFKNEKIERPKHYLSGLNEGYAELWSYVLLRDKDFVNKYIHISDRKTFDQILRYRLLTSLRLHLVALQMERKLREPGQTVEKLIAVHDELTDQFLGIKKSLPFTFFFPQSKNPGYLPSYLMIYSVINKHLNETNSLQDLINLPNIINQKPSSFYLQL